MSRQKLRIHNTPVDNLVSNLQRRSWRDARFIECNRFAEKQNHAISHKELPEQWSDLDGDGQVEAFDLAIVLGSWGPCEGCAADFNGDSVIDASDLAVLLGVWGACS